MRAPLLLAIAALVSAGAASAQDAADRKRILHELDGPFIVYRSSVQEELKLSDEQKQGLQDRLPATIQDATKLFESAKGVSADERGPVVRSLRQTSYEKLWGLLHETLTPEQLQRFGQLELQHEGPAVLVARPEVVNALQVTMDERQRIIALIRQMQRKIEAIQQAQSPGNSSDISPKVVAVRRDYDDKAAATLTDAQRAHWREMLGPPFDVFTDD